MRSRLNNQQHGFTLVEAVMVIVITGIIAGIVAVFIQRPVVAYFDTARRAALTDVADTAARFVSRELQAALPNSVRVDGTGAFLEFVPVRSAGRYRAEAGPAAAPGDPLDFTSGADNRFNVLGPLVAVGANESLVVYNLGIAGSDVYETPLTVRRAAIGGGAAITFTATGNPLPFPSPGNRFQIVGTPVSYACDFGNRTLWRYSGYAFLAAQPASLVTLNGLGGVRSVVATNVTACGFSYAPGALQHNGLVSILLGFADPAQPAEVVTLQQQVNVDNVP